MISNGAIVITIDEFLGAYSLVSNPIKRETTPIEYDGVGFECEGIDFEYIKAYSKEWGENYIWTLLKCGHIASGVKIVDRLLYLITKQPWLRETVVKTNLIDCEQG